MTGQEIVEKAREMLDVPFHHQGHSLFGTDCAGVVRWVHREMGFGSIDVEAYERQPDGKTLMALMQLYGTEIPKDSAENGDVLVFRISSRPQHLGIKTDVGILHAYERYGKVTEHSLVGAWPRLIVAAFRFPGVV